MMIYSVLLAFVVGLIAGAALNDVCLRKDVGEPKETLLEPQMQDVQSPASEEIAPEFAVSGHARRVPWKQRRAEIEEAHRTKRRKVEEWGV